MTGLCVAPRCVAVGGTTGDGSSPRGPFCWMLVKGVRVWDGGAGGGNTVIRRDLTR